MELPTPYDRGSRDALEKYGAGPLLALMTPATIAGVARFAAPHAARGGAALLRKFPAIYRALKSRGIVQAVGKRGGPANVIGKKTQFTLPWLDDAKRGLMSAEAALPESLQKGTQFMRFGLGGKAYRETLPESLRSAHLAGDVTGWASIPLSVGAALKGGGDDVVREVSNLSRVQ